MNKYLMAILLGLLACNSFAAKGKLHNVTIRNYTDSAVVVSINGYSIKLNEQDESSMGQDIAESLLNDNNKENIMSYFNRENSFYLVSGTNQKRKDGRYKLELDINAHKVTDDGFDYNWTIKVPKQADSYHLYLDIGAEDGFFISGLLNSDCGYYQTEFAKFNLASDIDCMSEE